MDLLRPCQDKVSDFKAKHISFFLGAVNCSGNFNCGAGVCISKINPECDRVADCSNEADEKNCGQFYIMEKKSTSYEHLYKVMSQNYMILPNKNQLFKTW